jgi:hypothetical protein
MPPDNSSTGTTGATPGAGATPAQDPASGTATGATPAAGSSTTPPTGATPGADDGLGDTGKRILADARRAAKEAEDRARAAEAELTQIREAGQSEQEKALTTARREATRERDAYWQARFREAEVRGALRGAGLTNEKLIPVLVAAPHFANLKVSEAGTVEGIAEAITAFKQDSPELFNADHRPTPNATAGGGAVRPAAPSQPATMRDAIEARLHEQRARVGTT